MVYPPLKLPLYHFPKKWQCNIFLWNVCIISLKEEGRLFKKKITLVQADESCPLLHITSHVLFLLLVSSWPSWVSVLELSWKRNDSNSKAKCLIWQHVISLPQLYTFRHKHLLFPQANRMICFEETMWLFITWNYRCRGILSQLITFLQRNLNSS